MMPYNVVFENDANSALFAEIRLKRYGRLYWLSCSCNKQSANDIWPWHYAWGYVEGFLRRYMQELGKHVIKYNMFENDTLYLKTAVTKSRLQQQNQLCVLRKDFSTISEFIWFFIDRMPDDFIRHTAFRIIFAHMIYFLVAVICGRLNVFCIGV